MRKKQLLWSIDSRKNRVSAFQYRMTIFLNITATYTIF